MLVVIGLLNYTRKSSFTLLSYLSIPTEIFIEPKKSFKSAIIVTWSFGLARGTATVRVPKSSRVAVPNKNKSLISKSYQKSL